MDDLRAVMDAAGSQRAAVYGGSESGALSVLFATTYPERVSALVLYGAYPRMAWAPDYPDGIPEDVWEEGLRNLEEKWGRGQEGGLPLYALAPDRADDPVFRRAHGRWERLSASPGAAVALQQMIREIDVRHLLSAIRVPTLVVYRTADVAHALGSRYMGAHIPEAKVVELPGNDYFPHLGDQDAILDEIEEFLTGVRPVPALDRALATVLFTDIVSSTQRAAALGDDRWTRMLDRHDALVVHEVERHRGRRINTTGDGMLATFDGPGQDFTPARSSFAVPTSVGSPSTSANACQRSPDRARFSCRRRSRTWWPAQESRSPTVDLMCSKGCPTSGECSPSRTNDRPWVIGDRAPGRSAPARRPPSRRWSCFRLCGSMTRRPRRRVLHVNG